MEDAQTLCCVQFLAVGIQLGKAAGNVIGDTVKEGAGFFDILLVGGHGDIPLLHHAAHGVCDLVREHGIVLRPIAVQKVVPVWEEDGFLKILAVDPLVVDGNLGRGAGVQRIEQFRIVQKHRRLILFGGDGIVDVRKPDALGELAPKLKNPSCQMRRMGMVSCTDLGTVNFSLSCLSVFCRVLIKFQGLLYCRTFHEFHIQVVRLEDEPVRI